MTRLARRRRRLRRFAQSYPTVASLAGPQPAGACEAAPAGVAPGAATFVVRSLSVPVSTGAVRAEPASAWGYAPATARGGALATDAAPGIFAAPVLPSAGARAAGPVAVPPATVPALSSREAWVPVRRMPAPPLGTPFAPPGIDIALLSGCDSWAGEHCPAPTAHGAGRSRVVRGPAPRTPGAHFAAGQALAAPGLTRAASLGRRWRRARRFIGRRATEVRVFLMVTAAGLALLSLISLTAPDVEAPYEMHVDASP